MFPLIGVSMMTGIFLSLFYRRSFTFADARFKDIKWVGLAVFLHIMIVCYVADAFTRIGKIGRILSFLLIIIACSRTFYHMESSERIKTVMISSTILICSTTTREKLATYAALVAITQFLRKPERLKNALSTCRIMFGPVYVLLMAGAGIQFMDVKKIYESLLSFTAGFSPIIAATLFRPDNFELLKLACPERLIMRIQIIRSFHGLLMCCSLFSILFNSLWPLTTRCLAFVDITLYFMMVAVANIQRIVRTVPSSTE